MRLNCNWLLIPVFLIITLAACNGRSVKKQMLAEKIQYDVPVMSNDPQLDWWINNIEGSKREPFLKHIMEAAEKGDVRVFDYFYKPLSPSNVLSAVTDTIYKTLLRTYPPYEEYDTMIVSSVTYRDITKIRFLEEWNWNPVTLEIEKKILAIGPVTQKEIAGERFNQLLFWIALDDRFPGK